MRVVFLFLMILPLAGCLDDPTSDGAAQHATPTATVGFGPLVAITESTGREMSLAVDPQDDQRLLACSPTGTGVVGAGENHSDFWLSTDGGGNWTSLRVEAGEDPTDARGVTNEGGDCDVDIGPDGTLWTVDSWLGSLAVSWSTDGETWQGNALAAQAPVADRPWIRTDASGRLHMTYQDVQALNPSAIWYTSTADGTTWTPPVSVATATQDGAFTWTGDFVVSGDGQHLWSIYTRRAGPVTNDLEGSGPEQVWIAHSADAGASWASSLLSQRQGPSSFLYPSLDADAAGGLHAVWSELRDGDQPTFYAYSADGASWTEPVPLEEGQRTGAPWVAGAGPGAAHVLWSGSPDPAGDDQRWWFYVATVVDGGWTTVTTTMDPVWTGPQATFPEFNEVQSDADLRPMIAAVAPCEDEDGIVRWCPYFQRWNTAAAATPTAAA